MRDLNNKLITREAQGRSREAWSERSVYQTDELMDKNVIGGAEGGRAGQGSRSPSGQTRCVNGAVVSRKIINLPGEASNDGGARLKSATSAHRTTCVMRVAASIEESADGILAAGTAVE